MVCWVRGRCTSSHGSTLSSNPVAVWMAKYTLPDMFSRWGKKKPLQTLSLSLSQQHKLKKIRSWSILEAEHPSTGSYLWVSECLQYCVMNCHELFVFLLLYGYFSNFVNMCSIMKWLEAWLENGVATWHSFLWSCHWHLHQSSSLSHLLGLLYQPLTPSYTLIATHQTWCPLPKFME